MNETSYSWLIQAVSSAPVRTLEEVGVKAKTLLWLVDLVQSALAPTETSTNEKG